MASFVTNKGKVHLLSKMRGVAAPTNYYLALITADTPPTVDTNLMSDLTEIAAGNGYTAGGYQLTPNATDFDSLVENDTDDRGELQIKDVAFTASGGPIPSSGSPASYAVVTDDNGTVANREVYVVLDLQGTRTVQDGNPLTLQNCEIRAQEPA